MNDKEIIQEIIRIIERDGEIETDGECLDKVWDLLETHNYMNDSSNHT
jgi:hypothetical protein